MQMPFRRKAASAAAVVVVALLAGAAGARAGGGPQEQLARLRAIYAATSDLTARFVQRSHLAAAGVVAEVQGRVAFRKGGKMRWVYEGDDPQVIVSDGRTLWIHQVRDRTVLRQELGRLPPSSRLALDLLGGFEEVERFFQVGACGDRCVELIPTEPRPDLAKILVHLDLDGQIVERVVTEDPLGNRTEVAFSDVRRNAGVDDGQFAFAVPDGVQVLDMQGGQP
ncbi:MAG: hypothetical protein Kow0092_14050 [Deferrisomatales bacterium]